MTPPRWLIERGAARVPRRLLARAAGAVAAVGVALHAHAGTDCAELTAVASSHTTITAAAPFGAPATIGGAAVAAPLCRVQGVARPSPDSEIRFEVWLPLAAADWTGRLKVNGTGGYAGSIPYARLAQDVADGFVSAGSNMGHDGGEAAAWTLGHPEKVKDWGLRAHESVAIAAKAVSQAFYGRPVAHAYFEGCSNGGRQALMMAQNYPQLFDGIVAGAPSNFYPDLLMWLLWTGRTQVPVLGQPPLVSAAQRVAVAERVLRACDAADGLVDGQITDPRACRVDLDAMGPGGEGLLTAAQLAVFKAMYAGPGGERRYTGAMPGSEADWDPDFADRGGYGRFIGHAVYGLDSPPFVWRRDIDFSSVYDQVKQALTPSTAAPSPDLTAFRRRGGKLIQYHGWNDAVVPPEGSIGYFHALTQFERLQALPAEAIDVEIARLTPQTLAATSQAYGDRVREFHRLFMLPAVAHCGGGNGPSAIGGGAPEPPRAWREADHHVVAALIRWVEQGVAPEKIIASRIDAAGTVRRQRPLCPYPAQAVYRGAGSVDEAENFACRSPATPDRSVGAGDLLHVRNALTQRRLRLPER